MWNVKWTSNEDRIIYPVSFLKISTEHKGIKNTGNIKIKVGYPPKVLDRDLGYE